MIPAAWFSWCSTDTRTALRMRFSMVKHLGAAILSRQKPPKDGARTRTISTISSGVLGRQGNGHGVHVGKGLVNDALGLEFGQHRQGPDIAVLIAGLPSEIRAMELPRQVSW